MAELNLSNYSTVSALLGRHGFNFSKSLGQNFIVDGEICPFMAENCGVNSTSGVLEIGPGIGVLSRELSRVAKKVVSIEIDSKLLPILSETLDGCSNVSVISGDCMKLDLKKLIEEEFGGMDVYVCANLPYYITSPIIMRLLEAGLELKGITVMIQKEVAQRMCAAPGSRDAGAVTAAIAYYAKAERLMEVSKNSFMPRPKVDSTIIKLTPYENKPVQVENEECYFKMVKAIFSMRRKTLLNSLSSTIGIEKATVMDFLQKLSIDPNIRCEKLTLEQLALLSDEVFKTKNEK